MANATTSPACIVLVFISSEKAISNHPHALGNVARILRHIELENLEHVDLLRAGRKAGIAEDGAKGLALGNLLDHAFGNVCVKTGDQVAVIVGMDGAAVDLLGVVRQGQRQTPVNQTAEQQVKVGAVILDVGFQTREHPLIVVVRRIVDVFHVGIVQPENSETDVEVLRGHGAFGLDLFTRTADALFADFANVFVTCFEGFTVFVAGFGELYHDELAVPAVRLVHVEDGMGGGAGTGEGVEDDCI